MTDTHGQWRVPPSKSSGLREGVFNWGPGAALAVLWAVLPLGTAALEIGTGLALMVALVWSARRRMRVAPLVPPVLLIALALLFSELHNGAAGLVAALGQVWPLALAVAVPILVVAVPARARARAQTVGLWAALFASAVALGQLVMAGRPPWPVGVGGPFSHHLTLGYALVLPALVAAHQRRWIFAVGIGLGVLASGGSGPVLAGAVGLAALRWRPRVVLLAGVLIALAIMVGLGADPELYERVVLWAAGGQVAVGHPLGAGPLGARAASAVAQSALAPGFHFPMHAHDSALQIGALTGVGAWVGWAWLLIAMWRMADRGGRALIAALVVGGLTQDTLGDLEVVRALCAWVLIGWSGEPIGWSGEPIVATAVGLSETGSQENE